MSLNFLKDLKRENHHPCTCLDRNYYMKVQLSSKYKPNIISIITINKNTTISFSK